MRQSGIYCIKCKTNNKVYIGSAFNIKYRFTKHKRDLLKMKHHSIHLQRAWNKYSENVFLFEVLELIENPKFLNERENFWINFFQSHLRKFGFNILKDGRSRLGLKHTQKTKNKISKNNPSKGKFYENSIRGSKPVYQYNLNGKFIKKWNSLKEPSDILNITHQNISKCLLGERNSAGNYQWLSEYRGEKIEEYSIFKKIVQLSLNGDKVNEFKNITDILKLYPNFTVQCIWAVCNNKRKTAYSYIWKYKQDYDREK